MPVFSELLEQKSASGGLPARGRAGRAAAGRADARSRSLFILIAPLIIPLFTGDEFTPALDDLCVGLSQVLFPIVVLLGLTGLAVGILNVHDHFTIPAIAPLVWNVVIIAGMVGLAPLFEGDEQALRLRDRRRRGHARAAADDAAGAAPDRLSRSSTSGCPSAATSASSAC